MTRLPTLSAIKLVRALKNASFVELRQKSTSHLIMRNSITEFLVVIPMHGGDIKRGLMKEIIRQAGLTEKDFIKYI